MWQSCNAPDRGPFWERRSRASACPKRCCSPPPLRPTTSTRSSAASGLATRRSRPVFSQLHALASALAEPVKTRQGPSQLPSLVANIPEPHIDAPAQIRESGVGRLSEQAELSAQCIDPFLQTDNAHIGVIANCRAVFRREGRPMRPDSEQDQQQDGHKPCFQSKHR